MNIVLNMIWANVIYNQLNMAYIKTSSTYTGSNHDVPDVVFEILYEPFPINLILTSMQNDCFVTYFIEFFEQLISFILFINEDKDAALLLPLA
jgi:hypothetical protein